MFDAGESFDSPVFILYNKRIMKLTLELNNLAKSPVKKDFFGKVVKKTIQESGYDFLNPLRQSADGGKNISISIALVSKKEIKRLNKNYRKKDQVTDVLSFAEYKNLAAIKKAKDKSIFLGELILCYDDIKEYAKKRGLALKKEMANVVSHGILHLLGMKHGKKMFLLQKKIIKKI